MVEIIGVLGTLFILIAFTSNEVKRIRIINIVGSVLFVIYGLLKDAPSVWVLNSMMIFLNIYKVRKIVE